MEYLLTFTEGIVSFISPCILPMLPIYISYFLGEDNSKKNRAVINSIGFVLGFSLIFISLSIFASVLGNTLIGNIKYVKYVFGALIIVLGLNYMEIFKIKFLNKSLNANYKTKNLNFFKSFVFGALFSISWTPCIGTFLASALLLVASKQEMYKGIVMMALYSAGLGIPFVISAVLIEQLKSAFDFIKKHYNIIKKISGLILILSGMYIIFF